MTNFAYPVRSGLDYLIKNFHEKDRTRFLILFSETDFSLGTSLTSENSFLDGEQFNLRNFSNFKVITSCLDNSININRYRITAESQDPLVATNCRSIGVMLTNDSFGNDLTDTWLQEYTATFTAVDQFEFDVPDTVGTNELQFTLSPNRMLADGIFYTGSGFFSNPGPPGFDTITATGITPKSNYWNCYYF